MSRISRRQFLGGAAALGGAIAAGGLTWAAHGDDDRATAASTSGDGTGTTHSREPRADGTLVLVTLYGGNDGLNTVVPVGDPKYPGLRGGLALDPASLHPLSDGFALHPSLSGCKQLWDAGQLAVVHGVGFAELDRSHFHCMDVWQAGSARDTGRGWVGRWLDKVGTEPLDAVNVGRDLPLLMRGEEKSAAVVPAGSFALPGDAKFRARVARLSAPDRNGAALANAAAGSTRDLLSVGRRVGPIVSGRATDELAGESLGARLETVAKLIDAGIPARVYGVDLNGFDTHAAQAETHGALLKQLDDALHRFVARVSAKKKVTVAVYTEFGRRVAPNASAGTDHGHAGVMLVAGNVKGGHHGEPPSLSKLDDGDLATTTDYRAVLGGLAEQVLGIEATDLFAGAPKPMAIV
jgi:uncharacterized protein (DUF1501 family)